MIMPVIFVLQTINMKRYLLVNIMWIVCCLFLTGCTLNRPEPSGEPKHQLFGWLPGTWALSAGKIRMAERWQRIDSTNMEGASWYVSGSDSVLMEKLRITVRDSGTYYFAEVPTQNQGRRIDFRLVSSGQNRWVFENLQHDFPQRIIYERISSDSLKASVEGFQEGKPRREEFLMGRISGGNR
jgi:hypothetical protein